jgi:hypothetical protein
MLKIKKEACGLSKPYPWACCLYSMKRGRPALSGSDAVWPFHNFVILSVAVFQA